MLTVSKLCSCFVLLRLCVLVVCFGLSLFAMALFMLFSAVLVEWLLLKSSCVDICGMLFVMYGSRAFSNMFSITERSEMGLYDLPTFMSLLGLGIGVVLLFFMCEE